MEKRHSCSKDQIRKCDTRRWKRLNILEHFSEKSNTGIL